MFRKFFKIPNFLSPFGLIESAIMYFDGPTINSPDPINQGEARRDFLEAELDLASDVLAAQQLFGPQFAQSDFDILLNTILGQNTTAENRTQQISSLRDQENDLEGLIAEQQAIIDRPPPQQGGRGGHALRQIYEREVREAQSRIDDLQSDLSTVRGNLTSVQQSQEGDGTRTGGLAELLGGAGIADIARTQGLLDALSTAESSANSIRRDADIGDVQGFVNEFGSDEGIQSLRTDELNRALGRVEGLNQDLGNPIDAALNRQALEGLGEGLTDRERRELQQSVRTASEARGRLNDNVSILNEAEATVLADRNRLNQNRQFAQSVNANNLTQDVQDRQFALQTAQATQGAGFDPFFAVLGRSSGAPGIASQSINTALPFVAGTPSFDTTGGIDLALGQQANDASLQAALAGAGASQTGALIGSIGNLGGGLLGAAGGAGGFSSLFG